MTPEGIVVAAVEQYFSQPKFRKFSIEKKHSIQMGSSKREADVVLVDSNGILAAIAECKREGVEGHGPDQLKSYLSATDTRLGMFANSTEPNDWKFYENLGRNKFNDMTRSEFERWVVEGENNLVTRLLDFFRRFSRPKRSDGEDVDGGSVAPTPPVTPPKPRIIIKDRPLQSEYRENTVEPSLNGKPYYSEQNGFSWAANHQGIAECVPQHIKRIIHNEELEILSTRDELEAEISLLREDVAELEEQLRECEQEIAQRTPQLAEKRENLAGLEVHLKALTVAVSEPSPIEGTPDNSTTELNLPLVAGTPDDSATLQFEALLHEKDNLEQEISQNTQELARKKAALAKLEVELQGPTETELKPIAAEPSSHDARSVKRGFSWMSLITALISTIVFVFLTIYLIIFYASAADKAIFLKTDETEIKTQLEQDLNAGVNEIFKVNTIVNPGALSKAFQEWNLFVVMFPSAFLAFAIVLDYFWEKGKKRLALLLVGLTLGFDVILAIQISEKIHSANAFLSEIREQEAAERGFWMSDLNILTVIFCGFVVSLLVSITYHVMKQRWKEVSPPQERSKAADVRESQIKNEKMQREARFAVLKTEMENLQSEINQLKEKEKATQQKITKAVRTPIETQTVVLKAEMENLQSEIEQLNKKGTAIQSKIDKTRAEIQELSRHRNKRVVNRNKMESQINQFLNGWCRFVAHSVDGTSDGSAEIARIRQVAGETLDHYYQGVPDYPD